METPRPDTVTCPFCQHENPRASSFCNACGKPLKGQPPPPEAAGEEAATEPLTADARAVEAAFEAAQVRQRLDGESRRQKAWIIGCAAVAAIAFGAVIAVLLNLSGRRGSEPGSLPGAPGRRAPGAVRMYNIRLARDADEDGQPIGIIDQLRPGEFSDVLCFFDYEGPAIETELTVQWSRLGERRGTFAVRVLLPGSGETGSFEMPVPPTLDAGKWDVTFLLSGQRIGQLEVIVAKAYARRSMRHACRPPLLGAPCYAASTLC